MKLTSESSRKVMKDACEFLQAPLSGSKAVVFKRLQVAVRETAAKAALDAARNEKRAMPWSVDLNVLLFPWTQQTRRSNAICLHTFPLQIGVSTAKQQGQKTTSVTNMENKFVLQWLWAT